MEPIVISVAKSLVYVSLWDIQTRQDTTIQFVAIAILFLQDTIQFLRLESFKLILIKVQSFSLVQSTLTKAIYNHVITIIRNYCCCYFFP